MRKQRRVGFHYGAGILLASAVIVKIIGALFKIPISSDFCLSDKGFGYFSYAYDFFTPLYTLAMSGFPVALAQMIARRNIKEGEGKEVFFSARKLYTKIGFFFAGLVVAISLFWYYLGGKSMDLLLPFTAIAPAAFFCCAMSSYRGFYEGFGDMTPTAVSELAEASGKLILGFSFAYFTVRFTGNLSYGAAAAIFGISLGTAFAFLYLKLHYKRQEKQNPDPAPIALHRDPTLTKAILATALPVTLAALSTNMVSFIDVVTAEPLGAVLYGLRSKAYTLYNLVPSFSVLLAVSAVPAVADSDGKTEQKAKENRIASIFKLSAVLSFPMAAGLIAASNRIMSLLYGGGNSVLVGGQLLRIFGMCAFFTGLAIPMTGILQAIGKQKAALYNIAAGAVVKIILNCILIRIESVHIYGTAYGTLGCYALIFILHFFTIKRYFSSLPDLKSVWLKPFLAALVCGGVAWSILKFGTQKFVTLLAISAAVFVYFGVLFLLKCFTAEEIPERLREKSLVKFCMKHRILR